MRRTGKSQSGVMLIEALIGMLIFSIGILALIGMQAIAMKNTADARYRSEAAFLASQAIGQIWIDIANIAKYDKDFGAYAVRDNWVNTVAATLPGIDVAAGTLAPTIEVDPANNEVTVLIRWQQPGETATRSFQIVTRVNGAT